MDDQMINSLRQALEFSPDNVPLKLHLAQVLHQANRLEEAEKEYTELLRLTRDDKPKIGLARIFFAQGAYSKCNVILEQLLSESTELEYLLLHSRALLRENRISDAMQVYEQVLQFEPNFQDEELDKAFRISDTLFTEEDILPAGHSIQRPTVGFQDVGGMDAVKKEIELKIIKPILHPELYKAYGKKIGGGILLYGPPGCGKTFIARATAGQVNAQFISVGLNDILDMWIGNSEKNLHQVFEIARQHTPCVLFIDEIDALGASRSDMKQSAGRHLINQFLLELDGVDYSNEGILIIGATNTPWHLDTAFRRPGRFDRIIFIPPPDEAARASILRLKLANKPVASIDYEAIAKKLEHYSGADIEAIIDLAIEEKLDTAFTSGVPEPLSTKDLLNAAKKHKASTQEWFAKAKNFALFANEGGLYDDILSYMKIKK